MMTGVSSSVLSGWLVCSVCDPAEYLLNTELQQMRVSVSLDITIYTEVPGQAEGGQGMLSAMPSANYACGRKAFMSRLCTCQTIHIAPQVANWVWRVQEVLVEIDRNEGMRSRSPSGRSVPACDGNLISVLGLAAPLAACPCISIKLFISMISQAECHPGQSYAGGMRCHGYSETGAISARRRA